MTNFAFFDGQYGHLTTIDDDGCATSLVTTSARPGTYIRIDDGRQYPQLCVGGGVRGNTLVWADDTGREFARDCRARFYTTRAGYDRAVANASAASSRPTRPRPEASDWAAWDAHCVDEETSR